MCVVTVNLWCVFFASGWESYIRVVIVILWCVLYFCLWAEVINLCGDCDTVMCFVFLILGESDKFVWQLLYYHAYIFSPIHKIPKAFKIVKQLSFGWATCCIDFIHSDYCNILWEINTINKCPATKEMYKFIKDLKYHSISVVQQPSSSDSQELHVTYEWSYDRPRAGGMLHYGT